MALYRQDSISEINDNYLSNRENELAAEAEASRPRSLAESRGMTEDDFFGSSREEENYLKAKTPIARQNAMDRWEKAVVDMENGGENRLVAYNQSKFDQFTPIVKRANEQEQMVANDRRIAGAYMLCDAYNNGGMSNRALGEAFTTAFGKPVYGCQIFRGLEGNQAELNGWAGIYGQTQDPQTGKPTIGLIGAMSPQDQLMLLQNAKLGDRTLGVRRQLYSELSKGKTSDQMLQMGFQNPDGPYVAGGVGGKGVSALAGRTAPRHSRISFFASDGKGGGMESYYDGFTGEGSTNMLGNWNENAKGRWKQVSVGPSETNDGVKDKSQVRVFENSQTGERVTVKDGEMSPWEKGNLGSKYSIEQMKEQGRNDRAKAEIEAKDKRAQAYRDERKALREQNDILAKMQMLYRQKDGEPDQSKKDAIQKQIDELRKGVVPVANPDDDGGASASTPDAILGRQPVLGKSQSGGIATGGNGQVVDEYLKNSHPKDGEIDIRSEDEAKKARESGRSVRMVNENDGKVHYYVGPAKKRAKPKPQSVRKPVEAPVANPDAKKEVVNPEDRTTDDAEKEKRFKAWYSEKRKQHGMEDMSEKDAREVFERDWWRKFKERVSKNLDDMDNYSKIHGNK